jgi:magnesium transporter
VLHAPSPNLAKGGMDTIEIDFLVGRNFIVTVRSGPIASIKDMEDRIRANPKIMSRGCDFMLYFIADAMVDDYLPVLEAIEKRINAIQEAVVANPTRETFSDLMKLKADILEIRRATVPQLEVLRSLIRGHAEIIGSELAVYFRAVYEHLLQMNGHLDSFREEVNSITQVCLAMSSNQVNEVVKIFTVIAAIMMPPTLVASIFGMNFDFPEVLKAYGLWPTCAATLAMMMAMVMYFRKKRWL